MPVLLDCDLIAALGDGTVELAVSVGVGADEGIATIGGILDKTVVLVAENAGGFKPNRRTGVNGLFDRFLASGAIVVDEDTLHVVTILPVDCAVWPTVANPTGVVKSL